MHAAYGRPFDQMNETNEFRVEYTDLDPIVCYSLRGRLCPFLVHCVGVFGSHYSSYYCKKKSIHI